MKKLLGFYLFILVTHLIFRYPLYKHSNQFQLTFLDIGQGDSVLIKTPSNCLFLVDSGNLNKLTDSLIRKLNFHQKTIDLAVITHPDLDHYGGFIKLVDGFHIKNAFISSSPKTNPYYQHLMQKLKDNSTQIFTHQSDLTYSICGLQIEVLNVVSSTSNGSSVITLITFPDTTKLLLAGDIEQAEEDLFIQKYPELKVDILKANHHGSKSSNTATFLRSLQPKYFIIQSGEDNHFGHPHPQTLINSNLIQSTILRNDQQGDIDFFFGSSMQSEQKELKYQTQY